MKRILLLLVVIISLIGYAMAQNNKCDVYLQGQAVRSIDFEDETVWAATDSFLVKINKQDKNTTYYSYPDIVTDMWSCHLKVDTDGVKWIARSETSLEFDKNIYCFDGNQWKKIQYNGAGPIYSMAIDKNNNKWITAGVFLAHLYKIEQDSCTLYTPENSGLNFEFVFKIASDNYGNIWLINYDALYEPSYAGNNVLMKYDGNNWTSYSSEAGMYSQIKIDEQANAWIQYYNSFANVYELRKLDTISNSWSKKITLEQSYALTAIDKEHKFWFTNYENNGIAVYNGSDWSFYTTSNSQLPSNTVHDIKIDSDGTKWIATDQGLVAFDLATSINQESKLNLELDLFPNPAHDYITLKMPKELQRTTVDILNIQGSLIKSFNVSNNQSRLDVSHFPAGIYLVRIHLDENYNLKKFAKQ